MSAAWHPRAYRDTLSLAHLTKLPRVLAVTLGTALPPVACWSQDYPQKTVRMLVPFAPGAATDVQARLLSGKLQESLGQAFYIDNRPGATGLIAAEMTARAPADGYTLLFGSASLAVKAAFGEITAFDPFKDLVPIAGISLQPQFLIVHTSVPARSVTDLVALAKKQPGKLNAASTGAGSLGHLAIEMFNQLAGVNAVHIPYKGGNLMMTALLAGEVDFNFQGAVAAVPFMRLGKVRALAVKSVKRSPVAPELPTMESFYKGFDTVNWFALFVPAGVPAAVVSKLTSAVRKEHKTPQFESYLTREGLEAFDRTPAELSVHFRREVERYARIIKAMDARSH